MKVIRSLKKAILPVSGSVVTIGVFDGLHIGHRRVIAEVVRLARRKRLASVAVTFDPHPAKVLRPKTGAPSLISLKHRIRLMSRMGLDYLVVLKFTKPFSKIAPEKFLKDVILDKLRAKYLLVGENFYFGKRAGAGSKVIRKFSSRFGFGVKFVKPVRRGGHVVSSSLIRDLIRAGKLKEASGFLGRPVSVLGTVVHGTGLGRYLGYPTANVNPHHEVIPPTGVYAVRSLIDGRHYGGILNIGVRPTFFSPKDKEPSIEVHIFGFNGNLYGRDIEICFLNMIRPEKRFTVIADLVDQIRRDELRARSILIKIPLQKKRTVLI